jgi:hypothetical protein
MRIAKRCGKKSGTSRKASVMTFRGNKLHIIKNPSIMKDRESDSRGNVIASSNIDDRIKKSGEILSKNKMTFLA